MKQATLFLLLLSLSAWSGVRAQDKPTSVVPVTLGHSVAALNGPWKFHIGDNPQWADPNFDDSAWQDYTIDPKHPMLTAAQAIQSGQLPGWQQHGYPGYTGCAWYRVRLRTLSDAHDLALLMPQYGENAYEVYVNGTKIGGFGKLDGVHVVYRGRSKLFPIRAAAFSSSLPATLAIRVWNLRYRPLPDPNNTAGGLRGVPLAGPRELLEVFQQSLHDQIWKIIWPGWLLLILDGSVGLISLFLFLYSRSQREYLWAGVCLIGEAVRIIPGSIAPLMNLPFQVYYSVLIIAGWFGLLGLPMTAMYLLGVAKPLWRRAGYMIVAVIACFQLAFLMRMFGLAPPNVALYSYAWEALPFDAYVLLVVAIAIDGLRTVGRKAWLPLAPGLLFACGLTASVLEASAIGALSISNLLFACVPVAVLIVFLMRFTEQQRENARLVDDMRQAQEIQKLLIPAAVPNIPGFVVESVYLPAREVGGDFFQALPGADGSLLIVVGDVSGKGLKAAMTVSTIVGALRGCTVRKPAGVLAYLNHVLHGQITGFATCTAALIAADGTMTLANAGNLAPYYNGNEMAVESGLPLGILAESNYEETSYQIDPDDRLTFISDGVVEATNEKRELFGFERTQAISNQAANAIAEAAKQFGQQDDISVLSVIRTAALTVALA